MSLSVVPLDAVQMLGQILVAPMQSGAGIQVANLDTQAANRPSAQDAAAFAQAASVQATPDAGQAQRIVATELRATPPSATDNLGSRLAHQADALMHRFNSIQTQPAPANAPAEGPANAPPAMDSGSAPSPLEAGTAGAIGQMERAYLFAIEATMASHGSTESTKVFNTLLKGQ